MSQIEKALQRARGAGSLRGKPAGTGTALAPVDKETARSSPTHNLHDEVMAAANKQLARMGDSWFLSEVERADKRIISAEMKDERVANAFRDLRTKILERSGNRNCSILVCGVTEHCGASFIGLNLAVAFSFDESRSALLVDGNVANPAYDNLLKNSPDAYGITDYFDRDDVKIEQVIHSIGIRKLRLIPAGMIRKGTAEYFTSRKVRGLLKGVQQRYPDRYIIINTPPVTSSADTRILAEMADVVLLVVAYGRTTEQQIINAAKAIKPDKLLGIVFNDDPQLPHINWRDAFMANAMTVLRSLNPFRKQQKS